VERERNEAARSEDVCPRSSEESRVEDSGPGQYADKEWNDDVYYNWHRYYIPHTGRYNRADPLLTGPPIISKPISFAPDSYDEIIDYNCLYLYSLNSPLINQDINGLKTWKIPPESCRQMHNVQEKTRDLKFYNKPAACSLAASICPNYCSIFLNSGAECNKYFKNCSDDCIKGEAKCMKGDGFTFPNLLWDACRNKPPQACKCEK